MALGTAEKVLQVLGGYNLKMEGEGKYRCNSPFRPGSDSMGFTLLIEDSEHGAYQDHVTEESGSLYDLARKLNIAVPTVQMIESTKRPYEGLEDYARAHGIPGDILLQWHWRETTHQGRPALQFQTQTGTRWRFLDIAKGKPHYISEPGYARCWYGLSEKLLELIKAGQPLVICNGEISTIAARYHGVAATAMTGGEKGEIPRDLLEQLKGFLSTVPADKLKVIIALDCDKTGRSAARKLEMQLRGESFDVRAVDLQLGTGGDLADFCMLHTGDSAKKLVDLPRLPLVVESDKWKFVTLRELMKLPTIEWLVPRQIPKRGLCMVYGASGTYKSFFMLDISLKLANEVQVLYIAAEGEHGYRQRAEAWIKHHGMMPEKIVFELGQVDMFDLEEREEFTRLIEAYNPKLIVVDTFAMCSGMADENSARDMLTIVNGCKELSKTLDGVVVVVHHTNAEGKKERGSKVLRNACDTIIRLSLMDDRIMVESQKTKDTTPFEPYYLAPINVQLGYQNNLGEDVSSVVLLPSEKVLPSDDLTPLQRRVLEFLEVEPNASMAEIADAVESDNRGSIQRVVSKLIKRGYLRQVGSDREMTEQGRAALSDSTDSTDSADSTDSTHFPKALTPHTPGVTGVTGVSGVSDDDDDDNDGDEYGLPGFETVPQKRRGKSKNNYTMGY